MLKKLFRLAALLALVATIVWLTREHLLPTPRVADDPRPHFRSTPPAPEAAPDDLTKIKGIGPKLQEKLKAAGIETVAQLAEAEVSDLKAILDKAGLKSQDPSEWPAKARAALGGEG